MRYRFENDGSLHICGLLSSYPEIDGVPLRPLRVTAEGSRAVFDAARGRLELCVSEEESGLRLSCLVRGFEDAHDISPIGDARLDGFSAGFRQGLGIAGPSGRFHLEKGKRFSSDGLIAFKEDDQWLALWAEDHLHYRHHYDVDGYSLSARFDAEGTLAGETRLPDIRFAMGRDIDRLLSSCASSIARAMGARRQEKPAFHWCSWYYLYHNLDMNILRDYVSGFQGKADFSHIQIDAGYFPSAGDWLISNERFPQGMEAAGQVIRQGGFEPGVWIAPFMVGDQSRLFKEHPDWMLRKKDGSLVKGAEMYNEPKMWGYLDFELYVLDTSHPEAMEYLRQVFATYRKWGYTLFKTDFLLWGLQDSQNVARHTPGKTSFEYFRDVMVMIRQAIGDARWLGCIAPFLPCVGCVDMMRIAGDVGAQWDDTGFGPANMIGEVVADQYFNGKYWLNDPDSVMLRDFHIHMGGEQIEALALFQAMTGSVIYTSDPVHLLSPERAALLAMIRPRSVIEPRFPDWMGEGEHITVANRASGGWSVLLFNPTRRPLTVPFDPAKITGIASPCLWRWHGGPAEDRGYAVLPPRSAQLYFVSEAPLEAEPNNLWAWER